MWAFTACMVSVLLIAISFGIHRRKGSKCCWRLPPGSMGLPLVGETFQFFTTNASSDFVSFLRHRTERYGPVFKTNLAGKPIIFSTEMDFNNFIFGQEGRGFQISYPESFKEILGKQGIGELHGFVFKYLKSLVMTLFGPENLKQSLLPEIDEAASTSLLSWSARPAVELEEATESMIFNLTAKKLISYDPSEDTQDLKKHFKDFMYGLFSFPLNIPGTAYYRCMKGRKKLMKTLKSMLEQRLDQPREEQKDFIDLLVKELNKEGSTLTKTIALDLLFVLLFASFETTSQSITFCMKLLTDHPEVLEELTKEHDEILSRRKDEQLGISWEEYKSMTYTSQVIKETLRLANIAPVIFRKSLADNTIKGYTIPKDWTVAVSTISVHMNPELFPDPFSFEPSRWEVTDLNVAGKNFMAFGGGSRFCVGADFSRLMIAAFLHHLATKYRWKVIKGGKIIRRPGLAFPNGFRIQLFHRK